MVDGGLVMYIDASYGEGGGQVLRTALSLSSLTGRKVELENIRAGRDSSGLARQHLSVVEVLSDITNAYTEGVFEGSERLIFDPGNIDGGSYKIDIGTAGSITLLIHAVVPVSLYSSSPVRLEVVGGTDVRWSPTYDYLENVTLELLSGFGLDFGISLKKRGHYPEGGGKVDLEIYPSTLNSINIDSRGGLIQIEGVSHCSNLPVDIAKRQARSAGAILSDFPVDIAIEKDEAISTGSSITVWGKFEKTILGGSALGEPGKPAEKVGREAGEKLVSMINSNATVDIYTGDQLIPYIALFGGRYSVPEKTSHLETNAWICEKLLDTKISIEQEKPVIVKNERPFD